MLEVAANIAVVNLNSSLSHKNQSECLRDQCDEKTNINNPVHTDL